MVRQPKPRMKALGNGLYLVESTSKPGIGHKVDAARGKCGCPAGRWGKRCHHLVWAEQMDTWYRAHGAMAAPAAVPTRPVPFRESAGYKALAECFG